MIYKAKLPTSNSNVSHNEPVKEFALLLVGVVGTMLVIYWLLGLLVNYTVDHLSNETVSEIYKTLNTSETEAPDIDSLPLAELQILMEKIKRHSDVDYPISLTIVDTEHINALAFPTGHIVVFNNLLESLSSENGIAFVLAHELAHFQNRDHLRAMGRGVLVAVATAFLGIGDQELLQIISPFTDYTTSQFSQERERLADATALITIEKIYGHVGGATELFDILQKKENQTIDDYSHYFSSHPQIEDRIAHLTQLTKLKGFSVKQVKALSH